MPLLQLIIELEDETITRQETTGENVKNSILFIILSLLWGNNTRVIENLFVKTYIRDRLRQYEPIFKKIDKKEIETMKKILNLKRQNLAMLDEASNNIGESNGYPYRLRKDNHKETAGRQYVKKV